MLFGYLLSNFVDDTHGYFAKCDLFEENKNASHDISAVVYQNLPQYRSMENNTFSNWLNI